MSGRPLSTRWRVGLALAVCAALATVTTSALGAGVMLAQFGALSARSVVAHLSERSLWGVLGVLAVGGGLAVWPALAAGLLFAHPVWRAAERLVRQVDGLTAGERDAQRAGLPAGAPAELIHVHDAFDALLARLEAEENARRQFVGDAAHELRTPVTGLRAYLEAMRDGVLPCDTERVGLALGELGRLDRLIADLGKLASLEETEARPAPRDHDLRLQVREVLSLYEPVLSARGLHLEVVIPTSSVLVRANPDGVAEVLHNLLRNAADYAREGGAVHLRLDRTPGWVRLRLYNDVPAPVERPERFFERFYRADPSRARSTGGSGLGLSIARRLVRGMGGTIALRPVGRRGIEAVLRLPAGR